MNKSLARLFGICLIITLLSSASGLSQSLHKPVESKIVRDHFDAMYKFDSRLISGDYYQTKVSVSDGHPFFISPEWKEGSVVLDGIFFDDLLLKYDVSTNEIVLNTRDLTTLSLHLILKKKHISLVKMGDHSFRPFPGKFQSDSSYFCEVLAQGDLELLLLKSKRLNVVGGGLTDYRYLTNQAEYLLLNENLYRYRGRRTLFKLFPEEKDEIRDYIKINRLKYRRLKLDDSIKIVAHCNILIKEE